MIIDHRPNPDTPRDPLPDLPYPDVFEHLSAMPQRVYIVGSGPLGAGPMRSIPTDAYCIALNSSICQWRRWAWWMAADHRLVDCEWWPEVKPPSETRVLFSARLANRIHSDPAVFPKLHPHYYYRYDPGLSGASFVPGQVCLMPGILRGLTVAGSALQFAYYCGAQEVALCGIDMRGPRHTDGFLNPDPVYRGVWPWCANLSKLIGVLRAEGMTIYSISPTALGVELRD